MNKTCKNCKWWGIDYDQSCDRTDNIQTEKGPKQFSIWCTADDDQGLMARLLTGPDFGCVHFTAKH